MRANANTARATRPALVGARLGGGKGERRQINLHNCPCSIVGGAKRRKIKCGRNGVRGVRLTRRTVQFLLGGGGGGYYIIIAETC